MRNFEHYIKLFESTDTVGGELVAFAICSGRDTLDVDALRDLTLELPETLSSAEAIKIAKASSDWREFLTHDPIPPWALRLGLQAAGLTQAKFAEKMGLSLRAVQYYVAGERVVSGPTAIAARLILG